MSHLEGRSGDSSSCYHSEGWWCSWLLRNMFILQTAFNSMLSTAEQKPKASLQLLQLCSCTCWDNDCDHVSNRAFESMSTSCTLGQSHDPSHLFVSLEAMFYFRVHVKVSSILHLASFLSWMSWESFSLNLLVTIGYNSDKSFFCFTSTHLSMLSIQIHFIVIHMIDKKVSVLCQWEWPLPKC